MKYRLNKAETVALTLYHVPCTRIINGRPIITDQNYMKLAPNTTYESDDEALLEFLREYKRKVAYNKQLADVLESNGVPYETEMCKSCGGKVKKIVYRLVEVFE